MSKELYNKVIEAYSMKDENLFNAAARNWIESGDTPKFADPEANDLFEAAKRYCAAWRNRAINGRVSKKYMLNCIRKIMEKKLPNPYAVYEFGVIPEKVPIVDEPEAIQGSTVVLGVVNEDPVVHNVAPEETVQSIPEEKPEKPKLFNRHKKR